VLFRLTLRCLGIMLLWVQAMTADEFSRHKDSLISNKLQTDMSLGQEGDRAWEQVRNMDSHRRCWWSTDARCARLMVLGQHTLLTG
jgi:hypothetical protein